MTKQLSQCDTEKIIIKLRYTIKEGKKRSLKREFAKSALKLSALKTQDISHRVEGFTHGDRQS